MDDLRAAEAALDRPARFGKPETGPLSMPTQRLGRRPERQVAERPSAPPGLWFRRLLVLGGAVALTVLAGQEMALVLTQGRAIGGPALVLMVLFVALFAWVALSFTSALAGFVQLLRRGAPLGIDPDGMLPALVARTALLMPAYNEAPGRAAAAIEAMAEDLARVGASQNVAFFVLSDTTDPDVWVEEEAVWSGLAARMPGGIALHYRRRVKNHARKAGNIADWVTRHGALFPHMIILDADSVMSAEAIVRLSAAMEAHPDVGLIQTLPVIVEGRTLFARTQQFAGRLYGPLIAAGIAWWHGSEGNYWGHNAIIRTKAFADCAGLPELRGPKPFGGHVLSHDFVEAALMRRAGWAVHMVPALPGSWEEGPPSLADLAVRDRRWCQGNLQHLAILPAAGLHWVSRLHLFMGIGSYVTAPLWFLFLLTGLAIALQARFVRPSYFPDGPSLFPEWPVIDPVRAAWLFTATMALLLAPKLLAWVAMAVRERAAWGGVVRPFCALLVETVISGLLAPVSMLTQSGHVVAILSGRDSGWRAQRREGAGGVWREALTRFWPHTVIGVVLGVAAWRIAPALALWMSPVVVGLGLAVPLAALTALRGGAWLFATPEDRKRPAALERTRELRAAAGAGGGEAVARLAADPGLERLHRELLPPPRRRGEGALDPALVLGLAKVADVDRLDDALRALTREEKRALLLDGVALDRLLGLK